MEEAAPDIVITAGFFADIDFREEPLSERMAYLWVGTHGPVRLEPTRLAKRWGWTRQQAYAFVRRMLARGLFAQVGDQIEAVALRAAEPAPGAVVGESWNALRLRVFARDGFACTYCGSTEDLHCDHVVPRIRGGLDVESNLTTACGPCNLSKGALDLHDWLARRSASDTAPGGRAP